MITVFVQSCMIGLGFCLIRHEKQVPVVFGVGFAIRFWNTSCLGRSMKGFADRGEERGLSIADIL